MGDPSNPALDPDITISYGDITIRTLVSFDDGQYAEARAEARRQGISFAELCRRAVAQALVPARSDTPWMRLAGTLTSGDPDASGSVGRVVYDREQP